MKFENSLVVLDRDGIVNEDYGYVSRPENFDFIPDIFELCRTIQAQGGTIVIATNQSGIARGYYKHDDFQELTAWMLTVFETEGVKISKVYYCPHLDGNTEDSEPSLETQCDCRKPKPGMLNQAFAEWGTSLEHTYMLGDKESDMLAAKTAGFEHRIAIGEVSTKICTSRFENLREALTAISTW
jgi:D-glycero-D-manno-heptose 1,7-bisphosphate phosphatase